MRQKEEPMIKVEHINFSYTKQPFLEDISFEVRVGEIFGFLGPSGAGKSTLQKILTGLLGNYQGSAVVDGVETKQHTNAFYEKIGVDFEFPSLYEKLTARENLSYFASLYRGEQKKMEELLEKVDLLGHANKKVSEYSKGMKSRLNFIKALLHNPKILFLDEPTSGLDPSNARIMKDMILQEKADGKTIILTTHNMLDAAELCDHVAFIVDGKVKALDTPHNLIMSKGAAKVTYTYKVNGEMTGECALWEMGKDTLLQELIGKGLLTSIHSSEPTLDDIFMEITGRNLS